MKDIIDHYRLTYNLFKKRYSCPNLTLETNDQNISNIFQKRHQNTRSYHINFARIFVYIWYFQSNNLFERWMNVRKQPCVFIHWISNQANFRISILIINRFIMIDPQRLI